MALYAVSWHTFGEDRTSGEGDGNQARDQLTNGGCASGHAVLTKMMMSCLLTSRREVGK